MKVKELIEKLQKCNQDKDVWIRFALDKEDEIGYTLIPFLVEDLFPDEAYIYAKYPHTKEDCDFVGQVDLKEAYKKMKEEK